MSRRKRIHGHRRVNRITPLMSVSPLPSKWLDRVQTGLSVAGLAFPGADALNAAISTGRSAYYGLKGDTDEAKKHAYAAAVNTAAIIPGLGEAIVATKGVKGASKIAKGTKKVVEGTKKYATSKTAKTVGKGLVEGTKKTFKTAADDLLLNPKLRSISTAGNVEYWRGTGQQVKSEFEKADDKQKRTGGPGLNQLIAKRNKLKKGSAEYNKIQNQINKAYGVSKRYG